MDELRLKPLRIATAWKVEWNKFMDLEPDNDYPINDTWIHFEEDISYFTNGEYFMDVGFYGNYMEDRSGSFNLYVAKGNFTEGILYECFRSRSIEVIKNKIEAYMWIISSGEIRNYKGLKFGGAKDISARIYSAIDRSTIKRR